MAYGVSLRVEQGRNTGQRLKAGALVVQNALHRGVAVATANLHRRAQREVFGGRIVRGGLFPVSAPGNQLANRTGRARSHIASNTFTLGNAVIGVVGSPDKYVLYNEIGARIRAKGSGSLIIPTKNVMTGAGVMKEEWQGVKLRDVWKQRKLFVLGKKRGGKSGFVARHIGDVYRDPRSGRMKRRVELLFLLRKEVNLAARHMFRTLARNAGPEIAATVGGKVIVGLETLKHA